MIRYGALVLLLCFNVAISAALGLHGLGLFDDPIVTLSSLKNPTHPEVLHSTFPVVEHPKLETFIQIGERPLFFEGRRIPVINVDPPKPIAPPPPPPPPKPITPSDQFRLLGIVKQGGEKRALMDGPSVLLDWYREGAKLQEWTLSRIEYNSVILTVGKENAELLLFRGAEKN